MRGLIALEQVSCPLCGAADGEPALRSPDHYGYAPGTFVVERCRRCGLWYQNPRPAPEAFDAIYPPEYTPYQEERVEPGHILPDLARTCALIARHQPAGGRLLDIGAGPGTFLRTLRVLQPNWQTLGIEPSEAVAARARDYGLDVRPTTLARADLAPGAWDAVTLWNVLEHLPAPLDDLRQIRRLLRPGGLLYLALPLRDSWDARIFGRFWLGWELPRHFSHFDRASLTKLLDQGGFDLVHMESLSGVEYCFAESLRIALRSTIRGYAAHRLTQALLFSRPARLLVWRPYLALATWRRRTTVVTVVARARGEAAEG